MFGNSISRRGFLSHMTALAAGWGLSDGRTLGAAPVNLSTEALPTATAAVAVSARMDLPLKIVTTNTIPPEYVKKITSFAPSVEIVKSTPEDLVQKIVDADAFFGTPTPKLIAAAKRLQWVQEQ